MKAFLSILRNDVRIVLRDVKALLLLLIMPVLVISIFAKALGPLLEKSVFVEPFSIAVVDKESSVWTGILANQLNKLEILDNIYKTDEDEAREMIKRNEVAAAIVIPENITASVDRWEPEQGKVIGNSLLHLESQLIKNIAVVGSTSVSAGLAELYTIRDYEKKADIDPDQVYQDLVSANEEFINVVLARKEVFTETRQDQFEVSAVEHYAASLLAVFIMFASIPCIKLLAQERSLGISTRFIAAPTGGWQSISAKLLLSVGISMAQFLVVCLFLKSAAKGVGRLQIAPFIPVFLCTTVAAAAFSMLIASFATSPASTDLIANLSILLMAVIGGSVYPLPSLPALCRMLSALTINRWSAEGFLAALAGGDAGGISGSCKALLLLAALYFAGAIMVYRLKRRRLA